MTTIQHHLLTGTDLHQCKGADTATAGQVQAADGAGGATWTSLAGDVSGPPGATTVTDLTIASEARGDLLTRGATAWQRLAPGSAGYVLQTNGPGTDPTWVAPSGTTSDGFEINSDAAGGASSTGSVTLSSGSGGGHLYKTTITDGGGTSGASLTRTDNAATANPILRIGSPTDTAATLAALALCAGSGAAVITRSIQLGGTTGVWLFDGGGIYLSSGGIGLGTTPGTSNAIAMTTVAPAATGEIGMSAAGRPRAWVGGAAVDVLCAGDTQASVGVGTAPVTAGTIKLATVAPTATGEIGMSAAGRPRAWVGGAAVDVLCAGDALPDDYRWTWHHAPGGASSSGTGILAAPTYASGTRGADVTAYGLALTVPSGASVGAFGTIRSPNSYTVGAAHSMIKVLALLSDRTTNIQTFVGWGGSNAVFTSDTASGIKCLGFRFSSTHSDTNICAFINDGTTLTYHDMGVAPSTTLPRWFQIEWTGGSAAAFTILSADGTVLATWTTASSLPASSESMYFWTGHSTPASGTSTTYFYDGRIGFYR